MRKNLNQLKQTVQVIFGHHTPNVNIKGMVTNDKCILARPILLKSGTNLITEKCSGTWHTRIVKDVYIVAIDRYGALVNNNDAVETRQGCPRMYKKQCGDGTWYQWHKAHSERIHFAQLTSEIIDQLIEVLADSISDKDTFNANLKLLESKSKIAGSKIYLVMHTKIIPGEDDVFEVEAVYANKDMAKKEAKRLEDEIDWEENEENDVEEDYYYVEEHCVK